MRFLFMALLMFNAIHCMANHVVVDGVDYDSLADARPHIKDGSRIYLFKGIYKQGVYLKQSNLEIIGETGVIFDNATVDGKAALVLTGNDVSIESIECRNMHVRDGNGACIRFEGNNLTVRNLYAHNSQSGIMTAKSDGFLKVFYSRFDHLGARNGYAHAIYAKVGEFHFYRSAITSTKLQGSGIKSRSRKTIVEESLLASVDGVDSRLIDAADYGELIVKKSILQQGINSSNSQAIAYGLEKNVHMYHPVNSITIVDNVFILDRKKSNVLISYTQPDSVKITNNEIIGDMLYPDNFAKDNNWYLSRRDAFMRDLPYIPEISDYKDIVFKAQTYGEQQ